VKPEKQQRIVNYLGAPNKLPTSSPKTRWKLGQTFNASIKAHSPGNANPNFKKNVDPSRTAHSDPGAPYYSGKGKRWCALQVLNLRPPVCDTGALPLS
jgi:hypothetical protein